MQKKGNKNGAWALLYLGLSVAVSKIMTIDNGTTTWPFGQSDPQFNNESALLVYDIWIVRINIITLYESDDHKYIQLFNLSGSNAHPLTGFSLYRRRHQS
jgi:hypothetical protein